MIEKLRKKHNVLCTSRSYDEVSKLAKIRNFDLVCVGKHGGNEKYGKLEASTNRIKKLSLLIDKFSPELAISFCSPEAARVSFGMGIKHIAFCDSPHANAVMRLTLPLIQKLLIPWIIPKEEFSKYGIDIKNIIPYRAIDASVTIKRSVNQKDSLPFKNNHKKNILIRIEEEQASYTQKSRIIIPIIKEIVNEFDEENIVILGRYSEQIKNLRKLFGKKAKILKMSFDGKYLLDNTDVFLGSGGTMTAESALLGVPTISYNAVPNIVEKYLVKNNLMKRETNPQKINKIIKKLLESSDDNCRKRARKISNSMEDPIKKLVQVIENDLN
jgi:predicted glycosyltransferase